MAENSNIEWTDHTFNPWVGCTKISAACDNCYAESWAKRSGLVSWGGPRRRTSEANWRKPIKWNANAKDQDIRYRVFCASLADAFDNQVEGLWRRDLWLLIHATPHLDWLLLTKRPQNIWRFLPNSWGDKGWHNVWLGTTVENQEEADKRIPRLLDIPARVRFLSCEPLLGPLFLGGMTPDWVIAGGESGPGHRTPDPNWFRGLRDQCSVAGIPFLFKQWGGRTPKAGGRTLDGRTHDQYPSPGTADR